MKICFVTLAALLNLFPCFGQGYVSFFNTSATRVSTNGQLQAAAPVGSWYYALLVAPSTQNTIDIASSHAFDTWTFVGLGTNTGVAGRLNGSTTTDFGIQVPGFASTATCDFVVVGWSANIGSDWNTIRAGYPGFYSGYLGNWAFVDPTKPGGNMAFWFGISAVAQDVPLAPLGGPYNSVFGSSATGQIQGLNLLWDPIIPEPSAVALAGLTVAAIFVAGRRYSKSNNSPT